MSTSHSALIVRLPSQERLNGLSTLSIAPVDCVSIHSRLLHDLRDFVATDHVT
jgi:hypothetical protein